MKIVIVNLSGNVGKSTIAKRPRRCEYAGR